MSGSEATALRAARPLSQSRVCLWTEPVPSAPGLVAGAAARVGPGLAGALKASVSPREGRPFGFRRDSACGSGPLLPAVHTERGQPPRAAFPQTARRGSFQAGQEKARGRWGGGRPGGSGGREARGTHRDELESSATLLSASAECIYGLVFWVRLLEEGCGWRRQGGRHILCVLLVKDAPPAS